MACHKTVFWRNTLVAASEFKHDFVVCNGFMYEIAPTGDVGGFGGRRYDVRYNDGYSRLNVGLYSVGFIPSDLKMDDTGHIYERR